MDSWTYWKFQCTQQSGEKPLVSWQKVEAEWSPSGFRRETPGKSTLDESQALALAIQFSTHVSLSLIWPQFGFGFLTCIKGIMTGPVFCPMPGALLV